MAAFGSGGGIKRPAPQLGSEPIELCAGLADYAEPTGSGPWCGCFFYTIIAVIGVQSAPLRTRRGATRATVAAARDANSAVAASTRLSATKPRRLRFGETAGVSQLDAFDRHGRSRAPIVLK